MERHLGSGLVGGLAILAVLSLPVWVPSASAQSEFTTMPIVQQLYAKAKVEKEVDIWGPAPQEMQWIPAEFAKAFPGIEVKWNADLQAGTKIIAEAHAGRHAVDVWSNSLGGIIEAQKRGLFAKVDWAAFGVAKSNIFYDGEAAATHNFIYSVVFAKDRIAAKDLPSKWSDLTDPKWKDKLAASNFLLPRLMGFLALAWGPERTAAWGRSLIDNNKILITTAPMQNFLKTGERIAVVGDALSDSYLYADNGVPSGYKIMDIVPATQFAIDVLKNAPHPNAAILLATWLASPEGRAGFAKFVHEPDVRPGSTAELAKEIERSGAKVILEDVETMEKRATYYKEFSKLIRGEQ